MQRQVYNQPEWLGEPMDRFLEFVALIHITCKIIYLLNSTEIFYISTDIFGNRIEKRGGNLKFRCKGATQGLI